MISTDQIKKLREETGVSIMQCKKALEEAGGDVAKAIVILQKNSKSAALKKLDRSLGAGTVASYIHNGGAVGAMVLLASETDFVSRNEEFKVLARDLALHVAASSPEFIKVEDISEDSKKVAMEVFAEEVKDKPLEMREKILEGKLNAHFKDRVLMSQLFVKNQEMTVGELIEQAILKFGEKIEVVKISRFSVK